MVAKVNFVILTVAFYELTMCRIKCGCVKHLRSVKDTAHLVLLLSVTDDLDQSERWKRILIVEN